MKNTADKMGSMDVVLFLLFVIFITGELESAHAADFGHNKTEGLLMSHLLSLMIQLTLQRQSRLSLLMVEGKIFGTEHDHRLEKLGQHASNTAELFFSDRSTSSLQAQRGAELQ